MLTYVNALDPGGSTYHDTGMIWGARMISSAGIFADSPDTFASMPVARHIIFMTDGQMDTDNDTSTACTASRRYDQRISGQSNPSESELNGRHMRRFRMICNAAKGLRRLDLGDRLRHHAEPPRCWHARATPTRRRRAANRDALIARFREIGSNIGALRLTQ